MRTAQAFGSQKTLTGLFDERIEDSRKVEMKFAVTAGIGTGAAMFVVYASYGLGERPTSSENVESSLSFALKRSFQLWYDFDQ